MLYELIQDNNNHPDLSIQRHVQRHNKITADKTPVRDIETRGRYVENQTKKLESKEKVTYNRENIERNNIKDSTGKKRDKHRSSKFLRKHST